MTPAEHLAELRTDAAVRQRREVEALAATGRQAVARNSILIERLKAGLK